MLDRVDAALFDPRSGHACLFRGDRYLAYATRRGPAPLADGRIVRQLGVDLEVPDPLRAGIDAALSTPDGVHLFRGPWFALAGRLGRLGIDGWQRLPRAFHDGIDVAFHDRQRGTTTFVRGTHYFDYETGAEGELAIAPDALLDAFGSIYVFVGRDYAHWDPERRAIAGPLRRIGAPYGHGLPSNQGGGWPGASHVLAGPLVGPGASIWVWAIDRATVDRMRVRSHGVAVAPDVRDLVAPTLRSSVDAVWPGSQIVALELRGLTAGHRYDLELMLDDEVLDRVTLQTAAAASATGRATFVVGSCADLSAFRDAPVFDRMAEHGADAALLLGDNCYYVNALGESSDSFWKGGWFRADWDDPVRMLKRQLAARNQPELAELARGTAMHATWDDHDFGYNNSSGHDTTAWAGRELSSAIHRAMWGGPYVADAPIYYRFRIGPVEVFVTDSRYDKDPRAHAILGRAQLDWLVDAMIASDAPLKILALSSQLLYRRHSESFVIDAPGERAVLLDALGVVAAAPRIRGRVLVLSGDVHYSELARAPVSETPRILELTSSGIRTGEAEDPLVEWVSGGRLWAAQADAYAVVTAEIDDTGGMVVLEARDQRGELLRDGDRPCRTIWDLATGAVRQG